MKPKKYLFLIFLCLPVLVLGQRRVVENDPNYDKKWLHFGFTVGVNTMDLSLRNSESFLMSNDTDGHLTGAIYGVENRQAWGFHLGPVTNFRLGNYFDARFMFNLSFGQRNLEYLVAQDTTWGDPPYFTHTMQIESVYAEFPMHIKYKGQRLNNFRPYVVAGVNPKIDLAARKKIKEEDKPKIRFNRFDFTYEMGLGMDYYFPYFKFSTELKMGFGVNDLFVPEKGEYAAYTDVFDVMRSRMFFVSFHFE